MSGLAYDVLETYPITGEPDKKVGQITFDDTADRTAFFKSFVDEGFGVRIEKDGTVVINTVILGGIDCAKYRPTEETK